MPTLNLQHFRINPAERLAWVALDGPSSVYAGRPDLAQALFEQHLEHLATEVRALPNWPATFAAAALRYRDFGEHTQSPVLKRGKPTGDVLHQFFVKNPDPDGKLPGRVQFVQRDLAARIPKQGEVLVSHQAVSVLYARSLWHFSGPVRRRLTAKLRTLPSAVDIEALSTTCERPPDRSDVWHQLHDHGPGPLDFFEIQYS